MNFELPRPRSRILTTLLLLLFGIGAVPLFLFGLRLGHVHRERLEIGQKEQQLVLAESIAREVLELVTGKRRALRGMAAGLEAGLLSAGLPEAVIVRSEQALLNRWIESDPDLVKVMIALRTAAPDGSAARVDFVSAARGEDPGRFAPAEELLVGRLLEQAFAGEAPVATPEGPVPSLVLVEPVRGRDGVVAAIAGIFDLTELGERVEARGQQIYSVFVTDPAARRLLARSAPRPGEPDLLATDLVRAFRQGGGTRTLPFRVEGPSGPAEMLGAFAQVPETGWGVFVQTDAARAYYLVRKLQETTLVWAGGLALLALLLGTVVARRLVGPIRELADGAMRLARGDFSRTIGLVSRNELGVLAASFNHMAGEIESQMRDLERAARENKELFLSSIRMLAEAIDEKDPYTRGHSERVTRFAVAIARSLGLREEEVERIQIGALLHDVGKIGIDDRILRKPSVLTDEEFEVMKQHPDKGAHIMGAVRQLADIVPAMRFHHEKVDGTGYPLGLRGDAIPLSAQIVSVADTFDAMTTDRPYQRGMDPEYVIGKLKGWIGSRFREDVVLAFERAWKNGAVEVRRRGPVARPGPVGPALTGTDGPGAVRPT